MSLKKHLTSVRAIRSYIGVVLVIILCIVCDRLALPWFVNLGGVVSVPNIVGMKEVQAFQVLQQYNLFPIEAGKRFDVQYPEGIVIFQSPQSNMKVREGRRVYLTISGGEEYIEVPDLIGRSLRDAKITITNSNLRIGNITYDSSSRYPNEVVIRQSSARYSKAKPGAYIGITLSIGLRPGQIKVPNLINKSLNEARIILPQNNLLVGKINYIIRTDLNPNTVIDQFPRSGDPVDEGKEIELWVVKESETPLPEN